MNGKYPIQINKGQSLVHLSVELFKNQTHYPCKGGNFLTSQNITKEKITLQAVFRKYKPQILTRGQKRVKGFSTVLIKPTSNPIILSNRCQNLNTYIQKSLQFESREAT